MEETINELKKVGELTLDPAQLEQLSTQVQEQLAHLEAFPKSTREWIQQLADTQILQIHAQDVVDSTKVYLYQNIGQFQMAPYLKDALNCYSNIVYLVKRFLSPQIFATHTQHIQTFKSLHIELCDKYGIMAQFPRSILPELYAAFYDIFEFLQNTRLITEAEVKKSIQSYTDTREQVQREFKERNSE